MKTFKIEIPDGYEIDKDKSSFEKIIFKQIVDTADVKDIIENYLKKRGYTMNYSSRERTMIKGLNCVTIHKDFIEIWNNVICGKHIVIVGCYLITLPSALDYMERIQKKIKNMKNKNKKFLKIGLFAFICVITGGILIELNVLFLGGAMVFIGFFVFAMSPLIEEYI